MLLAEKTITDYSSFLSVLDTVVGIVVAIIGGYCALQGINYLENLRKRKTIATFSFETQLYARLYELQLMLTKNFRLLTFQYSATARHEWPDNLGAPQAELDKFYNCSEECLKYIKSTSDQLPAYSGWVEDYRKLIEFLVEVTYYKVQSGEDGFKYTQECCPDDRKKHSEDMCNILNRLMKGIREDQSNISDELFSGSSD